MSDFGKECTYNFDNIRDGDIGFSHGCDLLGWLIRLGQNGMKNANDLSQPNHAFFFVNLDGSFFAAEVGSSGITLNSIEEYQKKNNQIVGVMRWSRFDDKAILDQWKKEILNWVWQKQNSGYDFNGAIKSAIPWWPWGNDPQKEFCSEDVCSWLIHYGCGIFPAQDPLELYDTLAKRTRDFTAILGYKNT